VIGQELDFENDQHAHRRDRQGDPGHRAQQPAEHAFALARRSGEQLREQRVGKALAHPDPVRLIGDAVVDRVVVGVRRARQQHDLEQDEDVINDKQQRQQDG
jgi:hypothetical protein